MDEVATFFSKLATQATGELEKKFPKDANAAIVQDTGQDEQMSAWQAIAVHPMQVLETEYQARVRSQVADVDDDDKRRALEIEALSMFFGISGTEPQLLDTDISGIAQNLQLRPLVDREITAIRAQLRLARSLIDEPSALSSAIGEMGILVERAANLLESMAPLKDKTAVAPKLSKAIDYLGLFTYPTAAEAAKIWAQQKKNVVTKDALEGLAKELEDDLVKPLADPGIAVASVRTLYTIPQFYLLRLMHRYHGGSSLAEMTKTMKQEASGLITKGMHPAKWEWLTGWHEEQIQKLDDELRKLDLSLRGPLNRTDAVLRFFLKGGRAMYTALGSPQEGANDWDTGVLIDPSLTPKDWYRAFAAVNDVLTVQLDRLRFGYTQLLYKNRDHLASQMADMAVGGVEHDEITDFTRLGAEADELLRRSVRRSPSDAALALMPQVALLAVVKSEPHPVTVNGELIDIGIATRSSVELRELWAHLKVTKRKGVSGKDIPVPELAFFVDDFSTILREAVAAKQADRKLAKRLLRLQLVLAGKDTSFGATIAQRLTNLQKALPKTVKALNPSPDAPPGRLQIWTLGALLHDLDPQSSDPQSGTRAAYIASFDTHMADDAGANRLFDETNDTFRGLWDQIKDDFANEADKGAGARTLLAIQVGTDALARKIVRDFSERERFFGVAGLQAPVPTDPWKSIADLLKKWSELASKTEQQGIGPLVVTGALAARLQLIHAGLDAKLAANAWPVELIELDLCLNDLNLGRADTVLSTLMSPDAKLKVEVKGKGPEAILTVTGAKGFINIPDNPEPVILAIRPARANLSPAAHDRIGDWLVTPARSLALQWLDRAAGSMDFCLRELAHGSVRLLTEEILGRQL